MYYFLAFLGGVVTTIAVEGIWLISAALRFKKGRKEDGDKENN